MAASDFLKQLQSPVRNCFYIDSFIKGTLIQI